MSTIPTDFRHLPQALDEGQAQNPILAEAILADEMSDETALALVLQDVNTATQFNLSKGRGNDWEVADNMYRGYVRRGNWPNTDVARANLPNPVILEAVEKLMPIIYLSFFSDRQPFILEGLGKADPTAVRAQEHMLLWAIREAGFKEEIRHVMKDWLLYGLCAGKWGWQTSTKKKKIHKVTKDPKTGKRTKSHEVESYDIQHPTFYHSELRNVLFDPNLRYHDCRKGGYVLGQSFIHASKLGEMAEDPTYKNIPTREELAQILALQKQQATDSLSAEKPSNYRDLQANPETGLATNDPLGQPLEILERVSNDRVVTVLQRCIVIRNEENEFEEINWVSCAYIDVPGSCHGFGVAKLLFGEQKFQEGVLNTWVDGLALALNPAYQILKGMGPGTQQIKLSPGRVINETAELKPLLQNSVTKEAFDALEHSEMRASRRVGSNGPDEMPTQAMRTAQGVNSFNQEVVGKLQYEIELFAELVYIPVLKAFLKICKERMQPDDIDRILNEAEGKAYQGDIENVYNTDCEISILSSTKLSQRRMATQLLPVLLQLVQNQPVQQALTAQGKKFNFTELLDEALELAGWDIDSLIQDASPQEIQAALGMSPGAQQAKAQVQKAQLETQADVAKANAQTQGAIQVAEANGWAKAGVKIIEHSLQESSIAKDSAIARPPEGE